MDPYERRNRSAWPIAAIVFAGLVAALASVILKSDANRYAGVDANQNPASAERSDAYFDDPPSNEDLSGYRGFRATNLLGKHVKNTEGQDLGKIEDLVLNVLTGDLRYAVLSFGGFLGVGDDLYAIPVNRLHHGASDDELLLDLDRERLESVKHFARNDWPKKPEYWDEADRVYGVAASAQPSKNLNAFRASEIVGDHVVTLEKKPVGSIDDLVIDMHKQKIDYAVLKTSGDFGDNRLVAVPVTELICSPENDRPVLNVDRARLDLIPHFAAGNWPNVNDRSARAEIERGWKEAFPESRS